MAERGLSVDHSTIDRWVQRYAPELDKRCRPQLKACNDSWKVAETYLKVKKGLRPVTDLQTLIEQDHRFIKRLVKPGMGFFSCETAGRTLQGDESMHMIRKGQMHGVVKGDIPGQVTFIARLFGVTA